MRNRRVLIAVALALVAIAIIGFLVLRRSGSSSASPGASPGGAGTASGPGATRAGADPGGAAGGAGGAVLLTEMPAIMLQSGVPDRRIAGRVTSAGLPLAGATVVLSTALSFAGVMEPVLAVTGQDGRFDFGPRPSTFYNVAASAPKLTPALVMINLRDPTLAPPSDDLELRLGACEAVVFGVISDGSGGVVAGATIGAAVGAGAESGADGAYELCTRIGMTQVIVRASGYGSIRLDVASMGRTRRDVILVPEAVFVGTVVRADDEAPVPGAMVNLWSIDWGREGPAHALGITGEDGTFSISGLHPGRYRAGASAPGLAQNDQVEVLLEAGRSSERVLRLDARVVVRGRVVMSGKPVGGVGVMLTLKAPTRYAGPGISQADGTFAIDNAPIGELIPTAENYEIVSPAQLVVPATGLDGAVIEVRAKGSLYGRVLFKGKPVEGAQVAAFGGMRQQPETSDADGRYELLGLGAGEHTLYAQSDRIGAFVADVKVVLAEGERKELDLDLRYAGKISGVVVDQHGKPVPDAGVRFVLPKTGDQGICNTDADGAFTCGSMTGGGAYRVQVFASSGSAIELPPLNGSFPPVMVEDGESVVVGVRLEVKREELTISGRVVDVTGAAVLDAKVEALPSKAGEEARFNSWVPLPKAMSGQDGAFEIPGLSAGTYAVRASAGNGGEAIVKDVAAGARGVLLTVARPGGIDGRLVGYRDPPPVYIETMPGGTGFVPATVDGDRFTVSGLNPGRYLVTAQTLVEGEAKLVEVRPGEVTQVTMTSRGSGVIEGTVLEYGTDAPVAGMTCHTVLQADGHPGITNWSDSISPKTDAQGRVRVDPSPAGAVHINCFLSNGKWSNGTALATVPTAGAATVTMRVVRVADTPGAGSIGATLMWNDAIPRITEVTAGGPAAGAGLQIGDVVTAIDGASVADVSAGGVMMLFYNRAPGTTIGITVQRGAESKTVSLTMISAVDRE